VLILALACASPDPDPGLSPELPGGALDTAREEVEDGVEGALEETATIEELGDQDPDLDGWIFSDTTVHALDITLDDSALTGLAASPYEWVPGAFAMDGEEVGLVGVRLRGKIGSFRTLSGKPKFAIDFNQYVEDQRFYGLESLNLNNSVVDCSFLKEPLGYRVFQLAGVPTQRFGFATVRVNGAEYGLYVLVESPDDRMLRRLYPDATGNLYDGKYVWYGGYSYTLLDFNTGVDHLYQLEEGVPVENADIAEVSAAVAASAGGEFRMGTLPVLDWEEVHRELAGEQWVGHNDGYALNTNNYRVYFDPSDGRAELIPWDLDYAFLHDYDWGMSWSSPRGQLAAWCWRDASCRREQAAAMGELLAAVDPTALASWFEGVAALTRAQALSDPRQECGAANVEPYRDYLRSWIGTNHDAMRAFWGL
jgi:spore coat protein CotH